jgi:energy-coupling factor transport system permease protein
LHPTLKILLLILLAIVVQHASLPLLAFAGCALLLLALLQQVTLLRKLLLRSRWLLLTLLLIYACTTPGEYLHGWESLPLTYEGLHHGLLQAARLTVMLAGLALLLGTTPRDNLMAGIYRLIYPLQYLGISPDRFAARLWLTLHYVELERPQQHVPFWQRFERASQTQQQEISHVRFEVSHFLVRDWVILTAALLLAGWSFA